MTGQRGVKGRRPSKPPRESAGQFGVPHYGTGRGTYPAPAQRASSHALDVHLRGVTYFPPRFANTAECIVALAELFRQHGVELVVIEASGGYERLAHGFVWAEGIAARIVNPRIVRDFAKSIGMREKTDRIDAAMIA